MILCSRVPRGCLPSCQVVAILLRYVLGCSDAHHCRMVWRGSHGQRAPRVIVRRHAAHSKGPCAAIVQPMSCRAVSDSREGKGASLICKGGRCRAVQRGRARRGRAFARRPTQQLGGGGNFGQSRWMHLITAMMTTYSPKDGCSPVCSCPIGSPLQTCSRFGGGAPDSARITIQ